MKNTGVSLLVTIFVLIAVGYPVWVVARANDWSSGPLLTNIFPIFGIVAVALLWIHSLSGVFETWLRKNINFDRFINITATIILICLISHPLLFLIVAGFNLVQIFTSDFSLYIWLGLIAWLLLITYDISKLLKKLDFNFFAKNWTAVLIISNIGFLIAFLHSLFLGSDLQSGTLRTVWVFYGITATLALTYTYILRPVFKMRR